MRTATSEELYIYSILCCVHFLFTLIYGSYFMCVNDNGYNFLGSVCDVKHWRLLLP